jgi:hypothetical protein
MEELIQSCPAAFSKSVPLVDGSSFAANKGTSMQGLEQKKFRTQAPNVASQLTRVQLPYLPSLPYSTLQSWNRCRFAILVLPRSIVSWRQHLTELFQNSNQRGNP